MLRFISRLLKSLWLFFPGILFLLLPICCFWTLGQGKDIIIAFIDNNLSKSFFHFYYTRTVFFLVIGFWAYVSWYSSRIISYIKTNQQEKIVKDISGAGDKVPQITGAANESFAEISKPFLDEFPRIIGNTCFLILELAVLQLPVLTSPISATTAWIILIAALILLRYINHWIDKTQSAKPSFRKVFWILLAVLMGLIATISFIGEINILTLFFLVLLFHIVFIYYTNLRRVQMEKKALAAREEVQSEGKPNRLERSMDFFCVPRKEKGYYNWFLVISTVGIILYITSIVYLGFARHVGPFSTVILSFAVLLAFGNVVTAFSVRSRVNFHCLLFLSALLIGGLHETHFVRTNKLKNLSNNYSKRPRLEAYLSNWLRERNILADSSADGYEIYFVMANGGASRSGYWTASVLGTIEDALLVHGQGSPGMDTSRFSDHVFCLSGTSGGGVGVATFFSLLRNKQNHGNLYTRSAQAFLKQDYFTYTLARMLGFDFFNYIIPFGFNAKIDRAAALEESFEASARDASARDKEDTVLQLPFYDNFSNFPALNPDSSINLPILCINTTRMQDGTPGVVTNLALDPATFDNRVDVVNLLDSDRDISLTSAAILGARFPYLSPAGRIKDNYFVDGGYFDNSGSGVVQEMIRGIINIGKRDSIINGRGGTLYQQVRRLHFKILHITNSPVILDSNNINRVAAIKNDLLSPILTIVGAYDMQTTVNDLRLVNFIDDIDSFTINKADYTQIPLYKDDLEWEKDPMSKLHPGEPEPSYAMNWFMSDTTLCRINKRLLNNSSLNNLINRLNNKRRSPKP